MPSSKIQAVLPKPPQQRLESNLFLSQNNLLQPRLINNRRPIGWLRNASVLENIENLWSTFPSIRRRQDSPMISLKINDGGQMVASQSPSPLLQVPPRSSWWSRYLNSLQQRTKQQKTTDSFHPQPSYPSRAIHAYDQPDLSQMSSYLQSAIQQQLPDLMKMFSNGQPIQFQLNQIELIPTGVENGQPGKLSSTYGDVLTNSRPQSTGSKMISSSSILSPSYSLNNQLISRPINNPRAVIAQPISFNNARVHHPNQRSATTASVSNPENLYGVKFYSIPSRLTSSPYSYYAFQTSSSSQPLLRKNFTPQSDRGPNKSQPLSISSASNRLAATSNSNRIIDQSKSIISSSLKGEINMMKTANGDIGNNFTTGKNCFKQTNRTSVEKILSMKENGLFASQC